VFLGNAAAAAAAAPRRPAAPPRRACLQYAASRSTYTSVSPWASRPAANEWTGPVKTCGRGGAVEKGAGGGGGAALGMSGEGYWVQRTWAGRRRAAGRRTAVAFSGLPSRQLHTPEGVAW
jgi:hypothetical protein